MKNILIVIAVLSLVLSGCAGQEEGMDIDASIDQPPEVKEKDEGTADVPDYDGGSESKLSEDIQKLVDKSEKVDSMEYGYQDKNYFTRVYFKGDKMKQDSFPMPDNYKADERYDTAYIDLSENTVEVYCEEKSKCDIEKPDIEVSYSSFVTETPFDVLEDIKGSAKISGTVMFDKKESNIVEYEDDSGKTVKVWVWDYRGIPLKYEIWKDDEKIKRVEFRNMVINQVKDEDVVSS